MFGFSIFLLDKSLVLEVLIESNSFLSAFKVNFLLNFLKLTYYNLIGFELIFLITIIISFLFSCLAKLFHLNLLIPLYK